MKGRVVGRGAGGLGAGGWGLHLDFSPVEPCTIVKDPTFSPLDEGGLYMPPVMVLPSVETVPLNE